MTAPTIAPFPPLAISLAGLAPEGSAADSLRAQLAFVAGAGYRSVALDATQRGLRPRELDRSARRDVASLLRRSELTCIGLDLWIPPAHFTQAAEQDRALAAVLAAIELAADLARLSTSAVVSTARASVPSILSLTMPLETPASIVAPIDAAAVTCDVRIANHHPASGETTEAPGVLASSASIGTGIDPAAYLLAGSDPGVVVHQLQRDSSGSRRLVLARLSDASTVARVPVGSRTGTLDLFSYAMALVTTNYAAPVVVDVRGIERADAAARIAIDAWSSAAPTF